MFKTLPIKCREGGGSCTGQKGPRAGLSPSPSRHRSHMGALAVSGGSCNITGLEAPGPPIWWGSWLHSSPWSPMGISDRPLEAVWDAKGLRPGQSWERQPCPHLLPLGICLLTGPYPDHGHRAGFHSERPLLHRPELVNRGRGAWGLQKANWLGGGGQARWVGLGPRHFLTSAPGGSRPPPVPPARGSPLQGHMEAPGQEGCLFIRHPG